MAAQRLAPLLGGTAGLGLSCWTRSLTGDRNCRKALQSCWEWESRTERALAQQLAVAVLGPQHHSGTKDVDTDTPAPSHSPAATGSSRARRCWVLQAATPGQGPRGSKSWAGIQLLR